MDRSGLVLPEIKFIDGIRCERDIRAIFHIDKSAIFLDVGGFAAAVNNELTAGVDESVRGGRPGVNRC